jgi:hypothetical protein
VDGTGYSVGVAGYLKTRRLGVSGLRHGLPL